MPFSNEKFQSLFDHSTKTAADKNKIPPELYKAYNVKRGLRNEDGTGVLVGLTTIGEVHGYIVNEFQMSTQETEITRYISPTPFIPYYPAELQARCERILQIQAHALKQRIQYTKSKKLVIVV